MKIHLPGTEVTTEWVLITPDLAREWLGSNTDNRTLNDRHVRKIAKDMATGRYGVHHQGIAFDENGTLIDAQHRLHAVVMSGSSIWMLVTRGLPSEAKRHVDQGRARAAHDFMPGKNGTTRAAAIRVVLAVEALGGKVSASALSTATGNITKAEVQEAWDRWPVIDMYSGLAMKAQRNVPHVGSSGLLAAALYYPQTGKEFLQGLIDLTGMQTGDPRLALIKWRGMSTSARTSTTYASFAAIKAARAFAMSTKMTVLKVQDDVITLPSSPERNIKSVPSRHSATAS